MLLAFQRFLALLTRMGEVTLSSLQEPSWLIRGPLVALAIPSIVLGFLTIRWFLCDTPSLLGDSVTVLPEYNVIGRFQADFHGVTGMLWHSVQTLPVWLAIAGIFCAWLMVVVMPKVPAFLQRY